MIDAPTFLSSLLSETEWKPRFVAQLSTPVMVGEKPMPMIRRVPDPYIEGKSMSDEINPTTGPNGENLWGVANYIDFDGNTHEFFGNNIDAEQLPEGWLPDSDLVTIWWTDADGGGIQFATLEGPFEDWANLDDVVDTYFEEGTP